MKTLSKIPGFTLVAVFGVGLAIVFTVLGQQREENAIPPAVIIKSQKKMENVGVVAIRRVNLLLGEASTEGFTDENRRPYVEIELYVGEPDFNTQLQHLVQIGEREFNMTRWNPSDDRYNAVLLIPAGEFDALKDGAEIAFSIGQMMPREEFKSLYDQGKLPENRGRKIGKLDKKMIDLEPTVEKSAGWRPQP